MRKEEEPKGEPRGITRREFLRMVAVGLIGTGFTSSCAGYFVDNEVWEENSESRDKVLDVIEAAFEDGSFSQKENEELQRIRQEVNKAHEQNLRRLSVGRVLGTVGTLLLWTGALAGGVTLRKGQE